jgi:hypothetical protein
MPTYRRVVGSVHAVPVQNAYIFCVTLPEADFAFFDCLLPLPEMPTDLLKRQQLFRVAVHKSAYNKGRWPRVDAVSVPPELLKPVPTFMRDAMKPQEYSIYLAGEIRSTSREECTGLEQSAVWDPEHVESRLSDHYAGTPNVWVKRKRSMKPTLALIRNRSSR